MTAPRPEDTTLDPFHEAIVDAACAEDAAHDLAAVLNDLARIRDRVDGLADALAQTGRRGEASSARNRLIEIDSVIGRLAGIAAPSRPRGLDGPGRDRGRAMTAERVTATRRPDPDR